MYVSGGLEVDDELSGLKLVYSISGQDVLQ